MDVKRQNEQTAEPTCPLCALWNAYKNSDAAKHLRGMQREGLLLVRSLLDAGIRKTEERLDAKKSKA